MGNPLYNTARGTSNSTLTFKPPFLFYGVTARAFPLKANMFTLKTFCDAYLNIMPPEIGKFQPFLPYVYFVILDYGKMAVEVANLGWVSQHEVLFAVPLVRYREEKGKLVYQDWGLLCPFIFVDNSLSLATGREVYGWAKVFARLTPDISPWMDNPRSPDLLMTLKTAVFPETYAAEPQRPRPLVEVYRAPAPDFSQVPPDLSNPYNPVLSFPRAVMDSLSLTGDLLEILSGLAAMGYPPDQQAALWGTTLDLLLGSNVFTQNMLYNQLTLKQFRDAQHPHYTCYQAIVKSQIGLERFNAGGLLGSVALLAGDLSGGYRIKIHRWSSQPIIESLGIEVESQTEIEGVTVATLKPVLPYWADVDLNYGLGEVLCWRTSHSDWNTKAEGDPPPPPGKARSKTSVAAAGAQVNVRQHPGNLYNTVRGAAIQEIAGPFIFPNATFRVLPLIADEQRLKSFCNAYLDNDDYLFEPWGSYVYLVVISFGEMASKTNNVGWWAESMVNFAVPMKWYRQGENGEKKLVSLALVTPFAFAESSTAAITGREVTGRPMQEGQLISPPDAWMKPAGPFASRDLLSVKTTLLPALGLGQKAEDRTLLEIAAKDVLDQYDFAGWRLIADEWGDELLRDHENKVRIKEDEREHYDNVRALALEILANKVPINEITLKQFRDSAEPDRACYQALVQTSYTVTDVKDLREIEDRMHVWIHQYQSVPIVDLLGLKVKKTDVRGGAVDVLQPIRPFWMKVSLEAALGTDLCWRAGTEKWESQKPEAFYFEESHETTRTGVGRKLVEEIDDERIPLAKNPPMKKQNLKATAREWLREVEPEERLTPSEARESIEKIEPQTVVESMLSREWEHWGEPRWWRNKMAEIQRLKEKGKEIKGYLSLNRIGRKPDFCIRRDSLGTAHRFVFKEEKGYRLLKGGIWYSKEKKKKYHEDDEKSGQDQIVASAEVVAADEVEALEEPDTADESAEPES